MDTSLETRFAGVPGVSGQRLTGHAATFNERSRDLGGFVELIEPGAFRDSLAREGNDVVALISHDSTQVLGRVAANTLSLVEDDRGLRYSIDLPATGAARDLLVSIERGDVSGMSFGFRVDEDEWDFNQSPTLRILKRVSLFEISVTGMPAYTDTSVAIRSMKQAQDSGQLSNRGRFAAEARQRQLELMSKF